MTTNSSSSGRPQTGLRNPRVRRAVTLVSAGAIVMSLIATQWVAMSPRNTTTDEPAQSAASSTGTAKIVDLVDGLPATLEVGKEYTVEAHFALDGWPVTSTDGSPVALAGLLLTDGVQQGQCGPVDVVDVTDIVVPCTFTIEDVEGPVVVHAIAQSVDFDGNGNGTSAETTTTHEIAAP